MTLEHCTVSRKTPLDGKLEITPDTAAWLAALGPEFPLISGGQQGTARVSALECTCAKGAGARHVHHFLESPVLRTLAPGTVVGVAVDDARQHVRVEPL